MNNSYFITTMFALIMVLLVTLFSMVMALIIMNKLKSQIYQSQRSHAQSQDRFPTQLPTAYQNSPYWFYSNDNQLKKETNKHHSSGFKRDRRSLESFCWIPTDSKPTQSVQAVQATAYYNKYGDFNSLHRSKQSIFLV